MIAAQPGWELYRSFLAVVRERSLSGAARVLGLTQPTVGRHVDALEEALGVSLFTRSPTGLVATPLASALVPHAEAMATAADALRRAASGEQDEERGSVRITASEMIGAEVLPPILARFRASHPRIAIELVLSNRNEDLLRREADLALRMVKPTQAALVSKKLGSVRIVLHGHPRYLATYGTPRTVAELAEHAIIGFDRQPSMRALPDVGMPITRDAFQLRCDSDLGQYAALRAGIGLGMCQVPLGRREGLVPVLAAQVHFELGVWLVTHEDLKRSRRVRLAFDALATGVTAYLASK